VLSLIGERVVEKIAAKLSALTCNAAISMRRAPSRTIWVSGSRYPRQRTGWSAAVSLFQNL